MPNLSPMTAAPMPRVLRHRDAHLAVHRGPMALAAIAAGPAGAALGTPLDVLALERRPGPSEPAQHARTRDARLQNTEAREDQIDALRARIEPALGPWACFGLRRIMNTAFAVAGVAAFVCGPLGAVVPLAPLVGSLVAAGVSILGVVVGLLVQTVARRLAAHALCESDHAELAAIDAELRALRGRRRLDVHERAQERQMQALRAMVYGGLLDGMRVVVNQAFGVHLQSRQSIAHKFAPAVAPEGPSPYVAPDAATTAELEQMRQL
jgi:hypothetical protein